MSKADYRVLEALADPDVVVVQSPSIIAYNIDLSRQQVTRSLSALMDAGLAEKVDRGKYRATTAGRDEVTNT